MTTNFLWGISTSSYQLEGATHLDKREACIWDIFAKDSNKIVDQSDGSIACDHYHRFPEDIALMQQLGIKAYRFSSAWSRIISANYRVNPKGLAFYDRLTDTLLDHGIEPWLCLYHWDLPQFLQDKGGWGNRDICQYYCDYVEIIARCVGDRIHRFMMFNEPNVIAWLGHLIGIHAPGFTHENLAYRVAHHLNLAQGMGLQLLRALNSKWQLGTIVSLSLCEPIVDTDENIVATQVMDALWNGSFLDPLFHGRYPAILQNEFAPHIEIDDMKMIQQPIDFLGVNYYTTTYAKVPAKANDNHSPTVSDICKTKKAGLPMGSRTFMHMPPDLVNTTAMQWEIAPAGFYHWLMKLKHDYHNPQVYITENGAAFNDDHCIADMVQDDDRIEFYEVYLQALFKARDEGANIKGFFAWTLLDNFEWGEGYTKYFGLVRVNRKTMQRSPKKSFYWYKNFIAAHQKL